MKPELVRFGITLNVQRYTVPKTNASGYHRRGFLDPAPEMMSSGRVAFTRLPRGISNLAAALGRVERIARRHAATDKPIRPPWEETMFAFCSTDRIAGGEFRPIRPVRRGLIPFLLWSKKIRPDIPYSRLSSTWKPLIFNGLSTDTHPIVFLPGVHRRYAQGSPMDLSLPHIPSGVESCPPVSRAPSAQRVSDGTRPSRARRQGKRVNSLLRAKNSLFGSKNSLLCCLGNLPKNIEIPVA